MPHILTVVAIFWWISACSIRTSNAFAWNSIKTKEMRGTAQFHNNCTQANVTIVIFVHSSACALDYVSHSETCGRIGIEWRYERASERASDWTDDWMFFLFSNARSTDALHLFLMNCGNIANVSIKQCNQSIKYGFVCARNFTVPSIQCICNGNGWSDVFELSLSEWMDENFRFSKHVKQHQ